MLLFILALTLLGLGLFAISLRKTYDFMPLKELKRLARSGDHVAGILYRAVSYGANLRLLLWIIIGVSFAGGFILLAEIAPPILAFFAVASLMLYGFAWMPTARITDMGARLTIWTTPAVAWLLNFLHPVLTRLVDISARFRPITFHTGLYERADLLDLVEQQRQLPDSRIPHAELDIVAHALTFGDRIVGDAMVPRRVVKMVSESDEVGPILMKELHDSGFSRFPVYGDNKEDITGTLYFRDLLAATHGGTVKQVASPDVFYVHEDASLYQVLHAFLTTKHHLYLVVNGFEEQVGIITIEDVLEQVIGHKIQDEFDKYQDMRAVAHSQAKDDHKKTRHAPDTEPEVVE